MKPSGRSENTNAAERISRRESLRWLCGWAAGAGAPLSRAAAAPADHAARSLASKALHALADHYVDIELAADPFAASWLGLDTPALASRLPQSIFPAERARHRQSLSKLLAEWQALPDQGWSEADGVCREVLHYELGNGLAQLAQPTHLLPLDQLGENALILMAAAADNGLARLQTLADHQHHLSRLANLPAWCSQAEANLREGVRRGIVWPRIIIERTLPMLQELAEAPAESQAFLAPLRRPLPAGLSAAERQALQQRYRQLWRQQLQPAVRRLLAMLRREVLPAARERGAGLGDWPGGAAWYAQCIRSATTTTMGAEAIHALGLAEVQRLREAMAGVTTALGLKGSHTERLEAYAKRPELYPFKTEAEVLAAYQRLNQRIEPGLQQLFARSPKAALEIRAEPALTRDSASDHYNEPAADGSRPGVFFAVILDPTRIATTGMTTLFLHEGRPGHHYQIALAQELPLSRMQRFFSNNAYAEGWALYAETLGHPLGLYADDPDAHLGHLMDAMLRAVRLVVDTGLHAKGWSREQAMAYLAQETGYDEQACRVQIERYMVNPGQALGYALGRLRIEAARDRARAALGERFSLAAFHEQVLNQGPLPLDLLDAHIDHWIAKLRPVA